MTLTFIPGESVNEEGDPVYLYDIDTNSRYQITYPESEAAKEDGGENLMSPKLVYLPGQAQQTTDGFMLTLSL